MRPIFAAGALAAVTAIACAQPTLIEVDDQDYVLNSELVLTNDTEIIIYGGSFILGPYGLINGSGDPGGNGANGERCGAFPQSGGDGEHAYDLTIRTLPSRTNPTTPAGDIKIYGAIWLVGGRGGDSGHGDDGGWFYNCLIDGFEYCFAQSGARGGHGGNGGSLFIQTGGKLEFNGSIDTSGGHGGRGGNGGGYADRGRTGTNDPNGNGGSGGSGGRAGSVAFVQIGATNDPLADDFAIYSGVVAIGGEGGRGGNGGSGGTSEGFAGAGGPGGDGGSIGINSVTDLVIRPWQNTPSLTSQGGRGGDGGNGGGGSGGSCEGCGPPEYILTPQFPCGSAGIGDRPCPGSIGKVGGTGGAGGRAYNVTMRLMNASETARLTSANFATLGGAGGTAGRTATSGDIPYMSDGVCECAGLPGSIATAGRGGNNAGVIVLSGASFEVINCSFQLVGGKGGNGNFAGADGCGECHTPGEQGGSGGAGGTGGALTLNASTLVAGSNWIDIRGGNGGDGVDGQPGYGQGGLAGAPGQRGSATIGGQVIIAPGHALPYTGATMAMPGTPGHQADECRSGGS